MKRTLSVILIVTMLLAVFVSCGGNVVDPTTQESTLQTTEITTVETTEATTDVTTEQTTEATTTNKPIVEKPKTIYDMVARQYTYHNDFLNK
ncbi:MAG: hypothetical protein MJ236_01005, partial [Clostridia bacterium]|nr:hypothetical protein [Clostridia bacterium]